MIYSFINEETQEECEVEMSYESLQPFLDSHPELHQTFRLNLGDPLSLGVLKPPADFQKNVIGRIRDNAPDANKEKFDRRFSIPREF